MQASVVRGCWQIATKADYITGEKEKFIDNDEPIKLPERLVDKCGNIVTKTENKYGTNIKYEKIELTVNQRNAEAVAACSRQLLGDKEL